MPLAYEIRHAMPGRVRLYVPALANLNGTREAMVRWLAAQDGITGVRLNNACHSLLLEYDRARPDIPARLGQALALVSERALAAVPQEPAPPPESPAPRWRALLWPTISLAAALAEGPLFGAAALALGLVNAFPILSRAYHVVTRERRLNVDFLDALAITLTTAQGNLFTSAFLTWLIRLGDWIRDQTAARSKRAITELLDFQDRNAWVLREGEIVEVPVKSIVPGETVVVYAGGMIPVDGEVLKGRASVDQKTITGESMPVDRHSGEAVFAATVVRDGRLWLKATRVGADTVAAQIVRLVEMAPVGETRMQNYAERFADRLVPPSLAVSAGLYAVSANLNRFISMVMVDYGTGIRVAAPTSVLASMTHAARNGVVIKSGSHMERLARLDTIVFDKTGTLTRGEPRVYDVLTFDPEGFPPQRVLALAAAAETRLKHPVAQAVLKQAHEWGVEIPRRSGSRYRIGMGVQARIEGHAVLAGSERFLRENNVPFGRAARQIAGLSRRGYSCLLLAVDGELKGLIPYADQVRPESPEVIRALRKRGIRNILMLTGDNSTVARVVASRLGLDQFVSEILPAEKAEIVQRLQKEGRVVAMVGDGINDSPALSCADVGIAMGNGADVARETASVVLMEDNLWKLITAVDVARDAMKLIRQNFAIIAALNTVAFGLAIPAGLVTPDVTALISNGSAILASLNAVRPIWKIEEEKSSRMSANERE